MYSLATFLISSEYLNFLTIRPAAQIFILDSCKRYKLWLLTFGGIDVKKHLADCFHCISRKEIINVEERIYICLKISERSTKRNGKWDTSYKASKFKRERERERGKLMRKKPYISGSSRAKRQNKMLLLVV